MPNYKCRHCGANNDDCGKCIICNKGIGSLKTAIIAGFITTIVLGVFWILISLITKIQLPIFALIFGGFVSFGVSHFSAGRGFIYQGIATIYTIIGILLADTISVIILWHDLYPEWGADTPIPQFTDIIIELALYDPFTVFFYILGVIGGFYIWR